VLGAASRFASPVQVSTERPGPNLERLLADIDAAPSVPGRDFTIPGSRGRNLRLDDEELAILQRSNKQASDYIRNTYMRSPGFLKADPEAQKAAIERVYSEAHTQARQRLYQLPTFRQKVQERLRAAP
jgi:hypothetical protein